VNWCRKSRCARLFVLLQLVPARAWFLKLVVFCLQVTDTLLFGEDQCPIIMRSCQRDEDMEDHYDMDTTTDDMGDGQHERGIRNSDSEDEKYGRSVCSEVFFCIFVPFYSIDY
jgi:hypothetical protein